MSASALWTAVKAAYDADGLITLTNIRDRAQTAVDDTVGQSAAQEVIDLWPLYAQEDYDPTDGQHVRVAEHGVIAVLWRRGGSSTSIEQVKWDEVFSPEGMVAKVRRTGPRGRQGPSTNSEVQQRSGLTSSGQKVRGWSDPDSLPGGRSFLPQRRIAED